MKKLVVFLLLISLLLSGCVPAMPTPAETDGEPSQTEKLTEPTQEATTITTQAPTEPTEPEKITVYLVKRSDLFDSGYTEYFYDEDHNIESYQVFTIENALMYTAYFEEKDSNGMPTRCREQWDADFSNSTTLTWSQAGMLIKEMGDEERQYDYDANGRLTEIREYYEGTVFARFAYVYEDDVLQRISCMDANERITFECLVEDDRIVERICYDEEGNQTCSHDFEYDINGNLEKETMRVEGETMPVEVFSYQMVEVDASRAQYLIQQQKYLLSII